MCGCVLLAAVASHVLPPGEYDRRDDPVTARQVVVAGTHHTVAPRPVGAFQALVAIPRGMADAAAVIFFVFLIGGAFTVVDETGALRQGVDWLVRRFGHSETLVIPVTSLAFALGGVLDNMKEEIIALVPVMLLHERDDLFLRSEEHTSELQSRRDLVCRLLLEKKKKKKKKINTRTTKTNT